MTANPSPSDVPVEIHQLNRLFLHFLRDRQARGGDMLGLPGRVAALLAAATEDRLAVLADYPQAMFRFELAALERATDNAPGEAMEPVEPVDAELAGLQSMLLVSAWHLCRQNVYAARLYLRLSSAQVHLLSGLDMSEIRPLAARCRVVRCAYLRLSWIWPELFRTAEPDHRRLLILLGLQPSIALGRPALLNP